MSKKDQKTEKAVGEKPIRDCKKAPTPIASMKLL